MSWIFNIYDAYMRKLNKLINGTDNQHMGLSYVTTLCAFSVTYLVNIFDNV